MLDTLSGQPVAMVVFWSVIAISAQLTLRELRSWLPFFKVQGLGECSSVER